MSRFGRSPLVLCLPLLLLTTSTWTSLSSSSSGIALVAAADGESAGQTETVVKKKKKSKTTKKKKSKAKSKAKSKTKKTSTAAAQEVVSTSTSNEAETTAKSSSSSSSSSRTTSSSSSTAPSRSPRPPSTPPRIPIKPNLVLISVDGLATSQLGAYGNATMRKYTRNLDAFADAGVLFEHATSAAGSTPSRASLLTGRYAVRTGLVSSSKFLLSFFSAAQPGALPDDAETLPEMLKSDPSYGKYVTGHFGTWHLGVGGPSGQGLPSHHGYDQFFGTPTPTSLEPCDNGKGWKDALKTTDKYGNPLGLQTEDTAGNAAAAAAAAKAEENEPLADDEEWVEEDDDASTQSSTINTDRPSRDYGLSFWAFWSLSSLLWQSILLSSLICWFAGGITSPQCGGGFLILLAVASVPFVLLDNLSMSDPNSCMLIRNGKIVEQPLRMGSYASRVTDEAMHFLESQMLCSRHRCVERESFMLSVSYALPPPKSLGALWDGITKLGPEADAVAEIDHRIGVLLKKIGHLGLMSRTLVVITGYAPDFFHRSKGQRPVRVPLLASFEGLSAKGKRVAAPVDLVDIVPTFLELAGVAPKFVLDGVSFWSTYIDAHAEERMAEGGGRKSSSFKNRLKRMRMQAEARILPHYCGDSVVGLSQGKYTMMFEAGDGHHSCMGAPHNPPQFCDRSMYPDCNEWIDLTEIKHLPKEVGNVASNLLNQWKSIEARVSAGDPGVRAITEWPVPSLYPCCRNVDVDVGAESISGMALEALHMLLGGRSSRCGCSIDIPPKKGQAPRAKPKTSYRPQFNPDGSLRTKPPESRSIGK